MTYDPWRDVNGTHIPALSRIMQVAVANEHGARARRLHRQGTVVDRRGNWLRVRFDGETTIAHIRPHVVRVVPS